MYSRYSLSGCLECLWYLYKYNQIKGCVIATVTQVMLQQRHPTTNPTPSSPPSPSVGWGYGWEPELTKLLPSGVADSQHICQERIHVHLGLCQIHTHVPLGGNSRQLPGIGVVGGAVHNPQLKPLYPLINFNSLPSLVHGTKNKN